MQTMLIRHFIDKIMFDHSHSIQINANCSFSTQTQPSRSREFIICCHHCNTWTAEAQKNSDVMSHFFCFFISWPQQQSIIFYGALGLRDFLFQNRKRGNSNCTSFRPKELPTSIHLKIVKSPKCFLYLLRFHQILISFVLLCLLGRMNGGA